MLLFLSSLQITQVFLDVIYADEVPNPSVFEVIDACIFLLEDIAIGDNCSANVKILVAVERLLRSIERVVPNALLLPGCMYTLPVST